MVLVLYYLVAGIERESIADGFTLEVMDLHTVLRYRDIKGVVIHFIAAILADPEPVVESLGQVSNRLLAAKRQV